MLWSRGESGPRKKKSEGLTRIGFTSIIKTYTTKERQCLNYFLQQIPKFKRELN